MVEIGLFNCLVNPKNVAQFRFFSWTNLCFFPHESGLGATGYVWFLATSCIVIWSILVLV